MSAARDSAAEELQWQQLLQEQARHQVTDPTDLLPGGSDVLSPSSNMTLDEIFGDMELEELLRKFSFGDGEPSPVGQPAPPVMPPPEATQPTFPPTGWGQTISHRTWGQPSVKQGTPNPMTSESVPTCPVLQQNDWLQQGPAQVSMVQITGAPKKPLAGSAAFPIVIEADTSPTL